jgi:magnesium transporter
MYCIHIEGSKATALTALPANLPETGFLWLDCYIQDGRTWMPHVERLIGFLPLEEHLLDAENQTHSSYYESTHSYEMIVFRGLAMRASSIAKDSVIRQSAIRIKTRPSTFFVFPKLLVTLRHSDSQLIPSIREKLLASEAEQYRLPACTDELMLKIVNGMVDRYLDLRQSLTEQAEQWQRLLLDPKKPFNNWNYLLDARREAHKLQSLCEEQLDAMQEWRDDQIERIPHSEQGTVEMVRLRELLAVRVNDIADHIKRVHSHGERLERTLESAVQLHFSSMSHRTNNIMRTLTTLTAIFLPMNLITGIFGMNFEAMPWLKNENGFWIALGVMGIVGLLLVLVFSAKQYLTSRSN